MFIEKIKTPGLAHLSYFVGSKGEAFVVDPRRDIECYLELASRHGCAIKYIFETHRNEDLISGSPSLAAATGAMVFHGPNADGAVIYAEEAVEGGQFDIGGLLVEVLETPGHTKDSLSYLLFDKDFDQGPCAIFTGDALFVGDVGRTDFYPDEMKESAAALYESIEKIKDRAADAQIYPAHGAGSVCGDGMADREFSTVAHESRNNPSLQLEKDAFIERKVNEQHDKPPYFTNMEQLNLVGAQPCERKNLYIDWKTLEHKMQSANYTIIDVRNPEAYCGGHIPGSLCIPRGMLSAYAGWLLNWDKPYVLIGDDSEQLENALLDLQRIGFDKAQGLYHFDAFAHAARGRNLNTLACISAQSVQQRLRDKRSWTLLDVRKDKEFGNKKIDGAKHIFLGELNNKFDTLDKGKSVTVMCQSGKRATVGASILLKNGFSKVDVFSGSMGAWQASGASDSDTSSNKVVLFAKKLFGS